MNPFYAKEKDQITFVFSRHFLAIDWLDYQIKPRWTTAVYLVSY